MNKKEMLFEYEKPELEQYGLFNLPVNADTGGSGGLDGDDDGDDPFN